jgi:hypothetical protein
MTIRDITYDGMSDRQRKAFDAELEATTLRARWGFAPVQLVSCGDCRHTFLADGEEETWVCPCGASGEEAEWLVSTVLYRWPGEPNWMQFMPDEQDL